MHAHTHTHTAGASEGTWPLWWNNHFRKDFLWLGQTRRDQQVILLEGKTHRLMLFQAVWQAEGLCIILAKMSDVPRCDVKFAWVSPVILSEDHLSCSSGPFYQSCSLTIWPNAPSRILTHTEQTLPKGYSKSQHPHKDCPMCRAINDRSNITVIFSCFLCSLSLSVSELLMLIWPSREEVPHAIQQKCCVM